MIPLTQKEKEENDKKFIEEYEFLETLKKINQSGETKNTQDNTWDNWKPSKDIR